MTIENIEIIGNHFKSGSHILALPSPIRILPQFSGFLIILQGNYGYTLIHLVFRSRQHQGEGNEGVGKGRKSE